MSRRAVARRRDRHPSGAVAPPPQGAPAAPTTWLRRAPLLAAALAFLVWAPSIAGGFLYDDVTLITLNPAIRDLRALRTVLTYEPSRPLLNLSWALNYAAFGETPWHYHLVNVLIHAGNAALAASLLLWAARRWRRPDAERCALAGACLFAASPMAAETVAYVASRSSALVTLFALGCLRVAVGVLQAGSRWRLAAAMGLFLLALATKEEAASVPLLLLLLDYFFVAGQRLRQLGPRLWIHGCFLALIPLGLAGRRLVTGSWLPPPAIAPGTYLLTQWAAYPLYFLRALVPWDPSFYRHHPPAPWPPDAVTVAGSLATVAIAVLAVRLRRRAPEWSLAAAWLAAALLPSSSIVALNEMMADHRAYLGSLGVAFALGLLLLRLGGLRLVAVVLLLFAGRAVTYEHVLADPVRAWEDAVRRAPGSADALCALGESYAARSDPRAESCFHRATQLAPASFRYWANLGLYYSEHGRLQEAAEALRAAAIRAPREATVRDYLGRVLEQLGRSDEAIGEYQAAIGGVPPSPDPYLDLAALLLRRGQRERVAALLDEAARLAATEEDAQRVEALRRELR